jgi:hypothetical protein
MKTSGVLICASIFLMIDVSCNDMLADFTVNKIVNQYPGDVRISNAPGASDYPSLAWTGAEHGVAWCDTRDGNSEIYFTRISAAGIKQSQDIRITNAPETSSYPSLDWTGTGYGVVWVDSRDGNEEIYFARLSPDGTKIIP